MAETSTFRGILEFFDKIGVYDVVLPFLLVFTIVFAIFEKTKVLGTEEIEGKQYTKKNLNSIASFVIAFLVIASSELVAILTEVSQNTVVLLFLAVFFLLLVGSFYEEGKGVFLTGGWKGVFMVVMFIGITIIFLQAIPFGDDDEGFLTWLWEEVTGNFESTTVGSIILLIIVILAMLWVTGSFENKGGSKPMIHHKVEEKK